MAKKLSAPFVDLVYEATLKSFWRKNALRRFLRQHAISDKFLASLAEETKREVLDRLFAALLNRKDGQSIILAMARDLAEQTTFPDLGGWEDSDEMVGDAKRSVAALKRALSKLDTQIVTERERLESQERLGRLQQENIRSQASLEDLSKRLGLLSQALGTQSAGYEFQAWFFDLMGHFEVVSRRPYRTNGREIDGSITIGGTTYLVELKFTQDQAAATDIDIFHKKVVDKADNTMGIMVSISGYSSVAISGASGPRTPLLLLDHSHLYLVLGGVLVFPELVQRVRRHASQTGEAYLPASRIGE